MTEAAGDSRAAGEPALAPYLRVVRGDASLEEVAVLTAVLNARAGAARAARDAAAHSEQLASRWADRSQQLRRSLPRGRDAWRAALRHP